MSVRALYQHMNRDHLTHHSKHSSLFVIYCNTSADYLLGISDNLPFKMGGLIDEQVESVLQFISLIERANEIIDKNK